MHGFFSIFITLLQSQVEKKHARYLFRVTKKRIVDRIAQHIESAGLLAEVCRSLSGSTVGVATQQTHA